MGGDNRGARHRQIIERLTKLWGMMPDDEIGKIIETAFKLNDPKLSKLKDEEAIAMLNDCISVKMDEIYKTKLHKRPFDSADNIGAWSAFTYMDYTQAKNFLQILRKHSCKLTKQEYTHIKDMALSGDITAAEKQLGIILENCFNNMERRMSNG